MKIASEITYSYQDFDLYIVWLFFTYEEASEAKGKKPLLAEIVEPAGKHWSNQVSNALNTHVTLVYWFQAS